MWLFDNDREGSVTGTGVPPVLDGLRPRTDPSLTVSTVPSSHVRVTSGSGSRLTTMVWPSWSSSGSGLGCVGTGAGSGAETSGAGAGAGIETGAGAITGTD